MNLYHLQNQINGDPVHTLRCSYRYRRGIRRNQYCGRRTDRPYCAQHVNLKHAPAPTITIRFTEEPQWLTNYASLALELDSPILESITAYLRWVHRCADRFMGNRDRKSIDEESDTGVAAALHSIKGTGPALTYPIV